MKQYHPILSCAEAQLLEDKIFGGDDAKSAEAMLKVGNKCADMFFKEFGSRLPSKVKILVLAGNGHNGGDAIITAGEIAKKCVATICVAANLSKQMRPNTKAALHSLTATFGNTRADIIDFEALIRQAEGLEADIIIDGLSGMKFKPPAKPEFCAVIDAINKVPALYRISIDIPSGASESHPANPIFKADVTYATASVKRALIEKFNNPHTGRLRYIDIGLFDALPGENSFNNIGDSVISPKFFAMLEKPRAWQTDKRHYGNLFVIAGSKSFPGAAMLNVRAALRAGTGIVTAFVPETLAPCFAAIEPSAIWVACPENDGGSISIKGFDIVLKKSARPTALLMGSGTTASEDTRAFMAEVLKKYPDTPCVLDADAICPEIAGHACRSKRQILMTPHEGEILRIASDASNASLRNACAKYSASIALKSNITRICDGNSIVYNLSGGPILGRGGSGDILAGICGALLSRKDLNLSGKDVLALSSFWLGCAAQAAFDKYGENSVATSDIIPFLSLAFKFAKD